MKAGNEPIIKIKNLQKSFGGVKAIDKLDIEISKNSITAIVGPNGAGKTTLFDVITGFIEADDGSILICAQETTKRKPEEIVSLGLARTFQIPRLFKNLSIRENLLLAYNNSANKLSDTEFEDKAKNVFEIIGVNIDLNKNADELSYGQRRIVEIARCFMRDAEIILMDEPTAGLFQKARESIKQVIKKLKQAGKTIVIIEHDMEFVADACEHVIVMDEGKTIASGLPSKVLKEKKVLAAYIGE